MILTPSGDSCSEGSVLQVEETDNLEPPGARPPHWGPPAWNLEPAEAALELADRWILSRLQRTAERVSASLESHALDDAAQAIYSFVWDEFCDWYVELAKPRLNATGGLDVRRPLLHVLEAILRLAHPFMPFITEAIWQSLPPGAREAGGGESVMIARYPAPRPELVDAPAERAMEETIEITRAIRNLRAELKVPPSQRIEASLTGASESLDGARGYIESLARVNLRETRPEGKVVIALAAGVEVAIAVSELRNPAEELAGIEKEIAGIRKELDRVEGKLGNEQFLARAPEAVVAKERRIQAELTAKLAKLEERKGLIAG
jgi:valyl-tRNA synthetase